MTEHNRDMYYYARLSDQVSIREAIHPDDLEAFSLLPPLSHLTIFECCSDGDSYSTCRRTASEHCFRFQSNTLILVPKPKFKLAQLVVTTVLNPPVRGSIFRIEWHFQRGHEVFFLLKDAKVSKRRYLPDELRPLAQSTMNNDDWTCAS